MWPGHVHVYIVNNLKAYLSIWREENKTQHIVIVYVWTEILDAMCKIKTNTKTQFLHTQVLKTFYMGNDFSVTPDVKGGGVDFCVTPDMVIQWVFIQFNSKLLELCDQIVHQHIHSLGDVEWILLLRFHISFFFTSKHVKKRNSILFPL